MGDARENMPFEPFETRAMARALEVARNAAGQTAPNPLVGCVLVKDGQMIAEGWHEGPGRDHAEVMALKAAGDDAKGATAFVTLEPCNHTGRTGPCTEALIEAGVAGVVYAVADPNPIAAGGADRLRAAGVAVRSGLCARDGRDFIRPWLHTLKHKRPFIVGKTAMSLDGRIATSAGESQWITAPESRAAGHALRRQADAIIVGANTVIADDPALTARCDSETRYPLRVVLDSAARTSPGAKVYERNGARVPSALIATTKLADSKRIAALEEMGVEALVLSVGENGRPDLSTLLSALFERDIHTAMIEGGGEVLGAFFDAGLIDEMHLFIAPKLIGGGKPAFGGAGVAALEDASLFDFELAEMDGPDQHWVGRKKETA